MLVGNYEVKRVLEDLGAGANIIFLLALINLDLSTKDVTKTQSTLVGFDGTATQVVGDILLAIFTLLHNLLVGFVVIDEPSIYNIIMGRP